VRFRVLFKIVILGRLCHVQVDCAKFIINWVHAFLPCRTVIRGLGSFQNYGCYRIGAYLPCEQTAKQ
jgi:hypothetical protein